MIKKLVLLFSLTASFFALASGYHQMLEDAYHLRTKDIESFRGKLKELELKTNELTKSELEFYHFLQAMEDWFDGEHEKSITALKNIIEHTEDNALLIKSKVLLSNIHSTSGNVYKSFEISLDLISNYKNIDKEYLELSAISVGFALIKADQTAEGVRVLDGAGITRESKRNWCLISGMKAEARYRSPKTNINLDHLLEELEECKKQGFSVISLLARIYIIMANNSPPEDALVELRAIEKSVFATKYNKLIAIWYAALASKNLDAKNHDASIALALRSLEIDKLKQVTTTVDTSVAATKILALSYFETGNYYDSARYYREHQKFNEQLIHDQLKTATAYHLAKLQTEEKQRRIEHLDQQNTLLKLEKKLAKQEKANTRLFMSLLLMLVAFLILWAYRTRISLVKVRQQAQTDALTGITNRHHFSELANISLNLSAQTGQPLALVLFDLDKFKSINDTYGHPVGDWVLKAVAQTCQKQLRNNDIFGRLGGEEFGILLPGCDSAKAAQLAEQYRAALGDLDTSLCGHNFSISASFGVTSTHISGFEYKRLITDADKALYQAKKSGRNQVVAFSNTN